MNAISLYNLSRFLFLKNIPFIPILIKYIIFLIFNSVVPYSAKIGKGSKLAYGGIGVVIHSKAIIGNKVVIGQNVTIGRQLDPEGVPVIGDNIYIWEFIDGHYELNLNKEQSKIELSTHNIFIDSIS